MSETKTVELENLGSLITIKGTDQCLGSLMDFGEKGVFDPSLGRVGVSPSDTIAHNKALDEAMVKGLVENCQVGQWGTFYLTGKEGSWKITTFLGTVVSNQLSVSKTARYNRRLGTYSLRVVFYVGAKRFLGSNNGFDQLLNFKRVK